MQPSKAWPYFKFLVFLSDLATLSLAFLLAFAIRFHIGWFPVELGVPDFGLYLPVLGLSLVLFPFLFALLGLYQDRALRNLSETIYTVLVGLITGTLFLFALSFFYREVSYSRLAAGIFLVCASVLAVFCRLFIFLLLRFLYRQGIFCRRALVVGTGEGAQRIAQRLRRRETGYLLLGCVGDEEVRDVAGLPVLGPLSQLKEIVSGHRPDVIFFAFPDQELKLDLGLTLQSLAPNAQIAAVPDFLGLVTTRIELEEAEGLPLLMLRPPPIAGPGRIVKRGLDLVLGTLLAAALLLPMIVIALLIRYSRLSSSGPALYWQERVGCEGKTFKMAKFRTMVADAEKATGPVWAKPGDPRVTRLGAFLRKTSLDELPQLWNVLKGEMSLVGPRPERPYFVDRFDQQVLRYMQRHRVKPGITGWAQVNGLRGDCDITERTQYDLAYVENWSLAFDLKILLRTFAEVLFHKGAY